ncbi:MAG: hypothetical protein HOP27_15965 [Anaerolineales bacterium]|nr:hypothetical protein [Anaerolineales bacterium]
MISFDDYYKKEIEHVINVEFPWYIDLIEDCFNFKRWGFHKIYSGAVPNAMPIIVYESNQCRVRFVWEISTSYGDPEGVSILYGRLHAPIDKKIMDWNGEKHYCWHDDHLALKFLDGLATDSNSKRPDFLQGFYQVNKNRGWRNAEIMARRHAALWEHYEQRLFDIFDLNHPHLWKQYVNYVEEYYSKGLMWPGNSEFPPLHKIC